MGSEMCIRDSIPGSAEEPDLPANCPVSHSELLENVVRVWEALAMKNAASEQNVAREHGPSDSQAPRREIRSAGRRIPPNLLTRLESTLEQLRWPVRFVSGMINFLYST